MVVNLCGTTNEFPKEIYRTEKVRIPYNDDTLACVMSCSKVLSSIYIATLVDKGLLRYTDKIVQHWPEYGDGDKLKESMTIENVLRQEGGMTKFSETVSVAALQRENIKKNSIGRI